MVIGYKFHVKRRAFSGANLSAEAIWSNLDNLIPKIFPFASTKVVPTRDALLLAGTMLYLVQILKMYHYLDLEVTLTLFIA